MTCTHCDASEDACHAGRARGGDACCPECDWQDQHTDPGPSGTVTAPGHETGAPL